MVQLNDNYWVISERLYGTGAYFRALAHHNRAKAPEKDRLPLGGTILAPDVSELERALNGPVRRKRWRAAHTLGWMHMKGRSTANVLLRVLVSPHSPGRTSAARRGPSRWPPERTCSRRP